MKRVFGIVAYTIAFYLALTAFFGYRLGLKIHAAKSNPYVGIASQVLGPQATESFIVQQAGLPVLITASPTFWLALHFTE
jgi:hypothetical protein